MAEKAPRPVAELSFEEALQELEAVVKRLEDGEVPLDASIRAYARGEALRKHCQSKLDEAQERVAAITEGPDGARTARPVDLS